MRIQGPNPYIQQYRNQQQSIKPKTTTRNNDQLKISNEALKLQQNEHIVERKKYVAEIKSQVQSGKYEVDFEMTAEKLVNFWNKKA